MRDSCTKHFCSAVQPEDSQSYYNRMCNPYTVETLLGEMKDVGYGVHMYIDIMLETGGEQTALSSLLCQYQNFNLSIEQQD